jgi:hypothetical protein
MTEVPEWTVLAMFYHQPVHRADAEKVLVQLSTLLQETYTLSTVKVSLIDLGKVPSRVASSASCIANSR